MSHKDTVAKVRKAYEEAHLSDQILDIKSETRILDELKTINAITKFDIDDIKSIDNWELRTIKIADFKRRIINSYIHEKYTFIDNAIQKCIKSYILKYAKKRKVDFSGIISGDMPKKIHLLPVPEIYTVIDWIFDELQLREKYRILSYIIDVPRDIGKIVEELVKIRNSIAHSIRPEDSKKYSIKYCKKSIYSLEGFVLFSNDINKMCKELDSIKIEKHLKKGL